MSLLAAIMLLLSVFVQAQDVYYASDVPMSSSSTSAASEAESTVENPIFSTPESRKFAAQQGALPLPLQHGVVVIEKSFGGFGIPEENEDPWAPQMIVLETSTDEQALAIADGIVANSFDVPGMGHVVVVRHGAYVSVYALLESSTVHEGERVVSGQAVGTPMLEHNQRVLHFEIRKDREAVNPLVWLNPQALVYSE